MTRPIVSADCESTSLAWDREAWEVALLRRDDTGTKEIQFFLPVDLSKADPASLRIGGYYRRHPHGKWVTDIDQDEADYVAVRMGRFGIGAELKPTYYEQAMRNLAAVDNQAAAADYRLFETDSA